MLIRDRWSELPGGTPVPSGTLVKLRLVADGSVITTANTDSLGFAEFRINGSPGPVYTEISVAGQTRYRYGTVSSQVGDWTEGELSVIMQIFTDGMIAGLDQALAVTPGSGLQVIVGAGAGIVDGILHRQYTAATISLATNTSGNPRKDVVVLRMTVGGTARGTSIITAKTGTPAASPVAPALTQNTTTWEIALAEITVANGAASITSGNIVDKRVNANAVINPGVVGTTQLTDLAVTTAKLADAAVATAKIADGSVTTAKLAASSVDATKIADGAVGNAELAGGAVTNAKIADGAVTGPKLQNGTVGVSQLADGNVTPAKFNIGVYGGNGSATTVSRSDHTHTHTAISDWDAAVAASAPASPEAIRYTKNNTTVVVEHADRLAALAGLVGAQNPTIPTEFTIALDNEYVQDLVAALITNGTGITTTYNDGAGSLTIASTQQITSGKFGGTGVASPMGRLNINRPLVASQNGTLPDQMDVSMSPVLSNIGRGGTVQIASTATTLATCDLTLENNVPYRIFALGSADGFGVDNATDGTCWIRFGSSNQGTRTYEFDQGVDRPIMNVGIFQTTGAGAAFTTSFQALRTTTGTTATITSAFVLVIAVPSL